MAQQLPVFETENLLNVTAYPGTAQVIAAFSPNIVTVQNFGDDEIFFSFDGVSDQGRLASGASISLPVMRGSDGYDVHKSGIPAPSAAFWGYQKIWLRSANGGVASEASVGLYP